MKNQRRKPGRLLQLALNDAFQSRLVPSFNLELEHNKKNKKAVRHGEIEQTCWIKNLNNDTSHVSGDVLPLCRTTNGTTIDPSNVKQNCFNSNYLNCLSPPSNYNADILDSDYDSSEYDLPCMSFEGQCPTSSLSEENCTSKTVPSKRDSIKTSSLHCSPNYELAVLNCNGLFSVNSDPFAGNEKLAFTCAENVLESNSSQYDLPLCHGASKVDKANGISFKNVNVICGVSNSPCEETAFPNRLLEIMETPPVARSPAIHHSATTLRQSTREYSSMGSVIPPPNDTFFENYEKSIFSHGSGKVDNEALALYSRKMPLTNSVFETNDHFIKPPNLTHPLQSKVASNSQWNQPYSNIVKTDKSDLQIKDSTIKPPILPSQLQLSGVSCPSHVNELCTNIKYGESGSQIDDSCVKFPIVSLQSGIASSSHWNQVHMDFRENDRLDIRTEDSYIKPPILTYSTKHNIIKPPEHLNAFSENSRSGIAPADKTSIKFPMSGEHLSEKSLHDLGNHYNPNITNSDGTEIMNCSGNNFTNFLHCNSSSNCSTSHPVSLLRHFDDLIYNDESNNIIPGTLTGLKDNAVGHCDLISPTSTSQFNTAAKTTDDVKFNNNAKNGSCNALWNRYSNIDPMANFTRLNVQVPYSEIGVTTTIDDIKFNNNAKNGSDNSLWKWDSNVDLMGNFNHLNGEVPYSKIGVTAPLTLNSNEICHSNGYFNYQSSTKSEGDIFSLKLSEISELNEKNPNVLNEGDKISSRLNYNPFQQKTLPSTNLFLSDSKINILKSNIKNFNGTKFDVAQFKDGGCASLKDLSIKDSSTKHNANLVPSKLAQKYLNTKLKTSEPCKMDDSCISSESTDLSLPSNTNNTLLLRHFDNWFEGNVETLMSPKVSNSRCLVETSIKKINSRKPCTRSSSLDTNFNQSLDKMSNSKFSAELENNHIKSQKHSKRKLSKKFSSSLDSSLGITWKDSGIGSGIWSHILQ